MSKKTQIHIHWKDGDRTKLDATVGEASAVKTALSEGRNIKLPGSPVSIDQKMIKSIEFSS